MATINLPRVEFPGAQDAVDYIKKFQNLISSIFIHSEKFTYFDCELDCFGLRAADFQNHLNKIEGNLDLDSPARGEHFDITLFTPYSIDERAPIGSFEEGANHWTVFWASET